MYRYIKWITHSTSGTYHVENVECLRVGLRLSVELHAESDRIDNDEREDDVLERLRGNHPPDLVLKPLFRYVTTDRLRFQCELDTVAL